MKDFPRGCTREHRPVRFRLDKAALRTYKGGLHIGAEIPYSLGKPTCKHWDKLCNRFAFGCITNVLSGIAGASGYVRQSRIYLVQLRRMHGGLDTWVYPIQHCLFTLGPASSRGGRLHSRVEINGHFCPGRFLVLVVVQITENA